MAFGQEAEKQRDEARQEKETLEKKLRSSTVKDKNNLPRPPML